MFSSQFLGITQSQALAVSLLDRSVNVVVLCLFFGFASIYINKKLKTKNVASLAPGTDKDTGAAITRPPPRGGTASQDLDAIPDLSTTRGSTPLV